MCDPLQRISNVNISGKVTERRDVVVQPEREAVTTARTMLVGIS